MHQNLGKLFTFKFLYALCCLCNKENYWHVYLPRPFIEYLLESKTWWKFDKVNIRNILRVEKEKGKWSIIFIGFKAFDFKKWAK